MRIDERFKIGEHTVRVAVLEVVPRHEEGAACGEEIQAESGEDDKI
jgi:hypothetical protein